MDFRKYINVSEKFVTDNSASILTAVGIVGTVTTAYLTGTASIKAYKIVEAEEKAGGTHADPKKRIQERAQLTWKLYIPAVSTAAVTITCIVGANRISNRRAAAMAAAYTISEKAFAEYKEKVVEKVGENKEQKIHDEIMEDRVQSKPSDVVVHGESQVLCFEAFAGRYFQSSMEEIKWAQNSLNHKILHNYYASLNEFYDLLGLPSTSFGEEVGWNMDELVELRFSTVMSDDQKPCIAIDFLVSPIRHYYKFR